MLQRPQPRNARNQIGKSGNPSEPRVRKSIPRPAMRKITGLKMERDRSKSFPGSLVALAATGDLTPDWNFAAKKDALQQICHLDQ